MKLKLFLFYFVALTLLSSCSKSNTGSANSSSFKDKREPRDNEFIKNGGFKIKRPDNPFKSVDSNKENLKDIPQTPEKFKDVEQKTQKNIEKLRR